MNGKKCKDGHNINPGTGNPSGLIRKSADADTNPKLGK